MTYEPAPEFVAALMGRATQVLAPVNEAVVGYRADLLATRLQPSRRRVDGNRVPPPVVRSTDARTDGVMNEDFTDAKVGDECWVYVDEDRLSEHYCVFGLEWFDERDGEIRLRKQKWKLLSDEPLVLPDPIEPDDE